MHEDDVHAGLASLMAAFGERQNGRGAATSPCREAQVMELKAAFRDYMAKDRFKIGDIVTPKSNSYSKGKGEPCIVVEVSPDAEPDFGFASEPGHTGSQVYGAKNDLRVLSVQNGTLCGNWVESWQFELYTGPLPEEA